MSPGWGRFRRLDGRMPVIAGVGRAGQGGVAAGDGLGAMDLMVRAARAAEADSGATRLLSRADRVAVPHGSWGYRDAGRLVARAVGAASARTSLVDVGIPQQALFNDAYRDLMAGDAQTVLIVGGEAAQLAADARRAGRPIADRVEGDDADPDEHRRPDGVIVSEEEIAVAGAFPPVMYALMNAALRHAERRGLEEDRRVIAELWARFNEVAAGFAPAAFPAPRAAAWLREPSPGNRPVAYPYNRWHCSQLRVDQAAALVVSTLDAAKAAGVDPERVVVPLVALESSFSIPVVRRREPHQWPAMEVLGQAAARHLGQPVASVPHAEVYSCFPVAVQIQQRALGLPAGGAPTITGGMAFAGGPWNNFVLQATVAMVERLRSRPGERGMVTAVSGFLNKPGLAVYSTEPSPDGLLVGDLRQAAAAATPTLPVRPTYEGPATVAAYTVRYDRSGEARTIVMADTPGGERCLASSAAPDLVHRATTEELVGATIRIRDTACEL